MSDAGTEAIPARQLAFLATKRVGWETNTGKLEERTVRLSLLLRNAPTG
jgi:hypothetical protein